MLPPRCGAASPAGRGKSPDVCRWAWSKAKRASRWGGQAYRDRVRTIGNILWFLLAEGGWRCYVLLPASAVVLIITIPFGIASFRLAGYVVLAFGRTVVVSRGRHLVARRQRPVDHPVRVELALIHLTAGLLLCVTIIGIPFGVACWKMVPLALVPLGTRVASVGGRQRPFRGAVGQRAGTPRPTAPAAALPSRSDP